MKPAIWGVAAAACLAWGAGNAVLALKTGIHLDTPWLIKFAVMVGCPLVASVVAAFRALMHHKAQVDEALYTDKPVDDSASTFVMHAGGVSLSLSVSEEAATTAEDRDRVVEAVRGVLAVTEVSK